MCFKSQISRTNFRRIVRFALALLVGKTRLHHQTTNVSMMTVATLMFVVDLRVSMGEIAFRPLTISCLLRFFPECPLVGI
jgi:hypothetical protein